jgi:hypothetical protein
MDPLIRETKKFFRLFCFLWVFLFYFLIFRGFQLFIALCLVKQGSDCDLMCFIAGAELLAA